MNRKLPFRLLVPAILLFFAVLGSLAAEETAEKLYPAQPYQAVRSNSVTYDVDFSVVVTPPYKAKKLQAYLKQAPNQTVTAAIVAVVGNH